MGSDRLRILILSTPKTGNTWLLNLLASIYDLPKLGLVCPFDYAQASNLGERWALFHHFMPDARLIEWIEHTRPFLLTTVRHPGDVLVSLYHHIHSFSPASVDGGALESMLHTPYERRAIYPPATHTFRDELECSLAWKRTGMTRIVSYEDLRLNTLSTLTSLAEWIRPVEQARIEQAIERCDIQLMRRLNEEHKRFFRSGEVGQWKDILTPGALATLGTEPYRSQVVELGYTLDTGDPPTPAAKPTSRRNPFLTTRTFANGVAVPPIIEALYLTLDPAMNALWPPVADIGPGSFFRWLNGPGEIQGEGMYSVAPLSRLALYLYRSRPDLQRAFPVLTGPDRVGYAEWFIRHAGDADYRIDPCFTAPVKAALVQWGNARCGIDRVRRPWWPRLTNYAVHLYGSLPEFQSAFPDYLVKDRWNLLHWMTYSDYRRQTWTEFLEPIRADLERCLKIRTAIQLLWPSRRFSA